MNVRPYPKPNFPENWHFAVRFGRIRGPVDDSRGPGLGRRVAVSQSTGAFAPSSEDVGPGKAGFFSRHPIGFWFFFWGELAERSSYYGMRAILLLYMTERL